MTAMQQIPLSVPGIPRPESEDGAGATAIADAHKALSDAQYLIVETHKDYAKALGIVRRLSGVDKEYLRTRGFDFEKLLDVQADLLSAGKLLTRQLNATSIGIGARKPQ